MTAVEIIALIGIAIGFVWQVALSLLLRSQSQSINATHLRIGSLISRDSLEEVNRSVHKLSSDVAVLDERTRQIQESLAGIQEYLMRDRT